MLPLYLLMGTMVLIGCKYDVGDELYGPAVDCDTIVAVSYSGDLVPILDLNCNTPACHGGGIPPELNTHNGVAQSSTEEACSSAFANLKRPHAHAPRTVFRFQMRLAVV